MSYSVFNIVEELYAKVFRLALHPYPCFREREATEPTKIKNALSIIKKRAVLFVLEKH